MRRALVAALAACADHSLRPELHRFLRGLSRDELQFIADFLGACILESAGKARCSRSQLAMRIAEYQAARRECSRCRSEDQEHKMILLLEYLCRGGVPQPSLPVRTGHA